MKAGRPYLFANVLDFDYDRIKLIRNFMEVMEDLSYIERSGLANGFGMSLSTVQGWRYSHRCPDDRTMYMVVKWNDAGRPMVKRKHQDSYFDI